jgi:hypothetical protein
MFYRISVQGDERTVKLKAKNEKEGVFYLPTFPF